MEIVVSLLIGIIIGSISTYFFVRRSQQQEIIRKYESQIQVLQDEYQQTLKVAKNRSVDGSRAVIKGKIAEQLAPILPDFKYLPSDARFIGDPIDYIVFNGYTEIKDNGGSDINLEIVILDIKTAQASLSVLQKAIAKAVNSGKVRFEVVRPQVFENKHLHQIDETTQNSSEKAYSIESIRKNHRRAYEPWSKDEEKRLSRLYEQGATITELAQEFQRQPGGIRSRLKKLGLTE
jgi:predicted Holliday junction resolvase-like endonuclease